MRQSGFSNSIVGMRLHLATQMNFRLVTTKNPPLGMSSGLPITQALLWFLFIFILLIILSIIDLSVHSIKARVLESDCYKMARSMTLKMALGNPKCFSFYEKYGWQQVSAHQEVDEPYIVYKKIQNFMLETKIFKFLLYLIP